MTMYNGKYLYYNDADRKVIDLPYGNTQFSMTVVVPNDQKTVNDLARDLNNTQLNTWLPQADTTKMAMRLPRFQFEYAK